MPDQVITTTTIAPEVIIRQVASPVSNLELILILSGIVAAIWMAVVATVWVLVRKQLRWYDQRAVAGVGRLSAEMREFRCERISPS